MKTCICTVQKLLRALLKGLVHEQHHTGSNEPSISPDTWMWSCRLQCLRRQESPDGASSH